MVISPINGTLGDMTTPGSNLDYLSYGAAIDELASLASSRVEEAFDMFEPQEEPEAHQPALWTADTSSIGLFCDDPVTGRRRNNFNFKLSKVDPAPTNQAPDFQTTIGWSLEAPHTAKLDFVDPLKPDSSASPELKLLDTTNPNTGIRALGKAAEAGFGTIKHVHEINEIHDTVNSQLQYLLPDQVLTPDEQHRLDQTTCRGIFQLLDLFLEASPTPYRKQVVQIPSGQDSELVIMRFKEGARRPAAQQLVYDYLPLVVIAAFQGTSPTAETEPDVSVITLNDPADPHFNGDSEFVYNQSLVPQENAVQGLFVALKLLSNQQLFTRFNSNKPTE